MPFGECSRYGPERYRAELSYGVLEPYPGQMLSGFGHGGQSLLRSEAFMKGCVYIAIQLSLPARLHEATHHEAQTVWRPVIRLFGQRQFLPFGLARTREA